MDWPCLNDERVSLTFFTRSARVGCIVHDMYSHLAFASTLSSVIFCDGRWIVFMGDGTNDALSFISAAGSYTHFR